MLYTFAEARTQLKLRVGNRSTYTDAEYGRFLNQAQQVIATNVRGLETFGGSVQITVTAGAYRTDLTTGPAEIPQLWAIEMVRDGTTGLLLRRTSWEYIQSLHMPFPSGTLTQWFRKYTSLYTGIRAQADTLLTVEFRRSATPDALEVPDEWVEHLLNLAMTFIYPTVGRNSERDKLYEKLPTQLQLAMLNPLSPDQWEAACDRDLHFHT